MTEILAQPANQPAGRPAPARTRRERMRAPIITLGALTTATLALHLRDPHRSGTWGFCPLAAVGVWCPGCGGLRAVNDLTNGDLLGAASSNLAFVAALPLVVLALAVWTADRWSGRTRHPPQPVVTGVALGALVLLAVFTVLRNLPVGSWLAP